VDDAEDLEPVPIEETLRRVFDAAAKNDIPTRLLLHDLADGGAVAVESLTPPLQYALRQLTIALGHGDHPRSSAEAKQLFIALAAPLFLLSAGWTVLSRVLELDEGERRAIFDEMVGRATTSLQ
jgi:hypothetical protein